MNITKNVINDLFPLYAANECSPDTRALVDEYLKSNPQQAQELKRVMNTPMLGTPLPAASLDEARSLRETRRRLRRRSWVLGFAIFFSLAPFSFFAGSNQTWWMLRDAPKSALAYGAVAILGWIVYAIQRSRSRAL